MAAVVAAEPSKFLSGQTKFAKLAYRRALRDFFEIILLLDKTKKELGYTKMYMRKKCPLEHSSTVESVDFSTAAMVVSNLEPVHHNFLSEIAWTPEAYQAICF